MENESQDQWKTREVFISLDYQIKLDATGERIVSSVRRLLTKTGIPYEKLNAITLIPATEDNDALAAMRKDVTEIIENNTLEKD